MPHRRRRRGRKTKFVTKRGLPFQMMKYVETKFKTISVFNQVLSDTASLNQFFSLSSIDGGSDQEQRVGNMAQCSGFFIRLVYEAQLTGQMQYIRVIVYTPRFTGQAVPAIDDMITPADPDLHKVWVDKVAPCPFVPGGGGGVMTLKKKFKPYMKMIWGTDDGEDIEQGQILVNIIGKNNLGTTASWMTRLYFKDM